MDSNTAEPMAPRFYTTRQVAALLSVTEPTVYRWCKLGKIKNIHLGRGYRIPESALCEAIGTTPEAIQKFLAERNLLNIRRGRRKKTEVTLNINEQSKAPPDVSERPGPETQSNSE